MAKEKIKSIFDDDLYNELIEQEEEQRGEFKEILLRDFKQLLDDEKSDDDGEDE